MKSRKILAILSIIITASLVGFVLAQMYMSVPLNFSGIGINTIGSIAIYQHGTQTPFTGFAFTPFTATGTESVQFDVYNNGNVAVYVETLATGTGWTTSGGKALFGTALYVTYEGTAGLTDIGVTTGLLSIAPGATVVATINLVCTSIASPVTANPLTLTLGAWSSASGT